MPTEITMPKLSDTMTEGVLVEWRKNVGQRVERGEILAEVETDKANMELESFSSGILLETRAKPGDKVAVGAVIAVVGEEGEKPAPPPPERKEEEAKKVAAPPSAAKETPARGTAEETEREAKLRKETGLGELGEGVTAAEKPESKAAPPPGELRGGEPPAGPSRERPETGKRAESAGGAPMAVEKASPLVRRMAREKGIDLAEVKGTGPEGRILREDLERYPAAGEGGGAPARAAAPQLEESRLPLSRMRAAIARKVVETWQATPHFAVTVEVDMGEAERLYHGLKEAGHRVSLNDFILKGCAEALKTHPGVNASFEGGEIVRHGSVDIGIAVALEEGLVIPVLRRCDRLSLTEIAAESRRLAEKAHRGKLTEDDMRGGTFTVSNLGMYGIDEFFAVINSPQSAILAVGAVSDKPCVRNGAVVAGRLMRATLSADHRMLDGATAARFMAEVKRVLENPAPLLL
jgi:pyruvate dehydrogenase E2 component (dihydrolipoamide acetyltransferase)